MKIDYTAPECNLVKMHFSEMLCYSGKGGTIPGLDPVDLDDDDYEDLP